MTHRLAPFSLVLLLAAGLAALPAVASDHPAEPKAAAKPPPAKEAPAAKGAARAAAPADDSLDRLRERLAEKLGAVKPPDSTSSHVVRVVSKSGGPAPQEEVIAPRRVPRESAVPVADKPAPVGHGAAPAAGHSAPHWAYSGEVGPQAWGGLQPEFAKCANGNRQSPIDIREGIAVDLEAVAFDYRASGFRVIDNGHTVQVNVGSGNSVVIGGRRYELLQFHFHRPSEERVDGRQFDMVAHLVHKDPEGRLAVVAVLLDRGSVQPLVQVVWNNLPLEKNEEVASRDTIDLNHLLPTDRRYYTYMGSLTTPPCSEGVLWVVLRQPVAISPEQIAIFSRLYPMNARPVQSAAGRMIKQSN